MPERPIAPERTVAPGGTPTPGRSPEPGRTSTALDPSTGLSDRRVSGDLADLVPGGHVSGDAPTAEPATLASPAAASTISPTATVTSTTVPLSPTPLLPGVPLKEVLHQPHQLGGFEGLGEKGVDAHVEAGLDLVLVAGADDGERQVVRTGIGPEPGGGAQSVEPRHDDVERHDVGAHLVHHVQTLGTIGRGHDLQPFQLEVDPDQLPDDLVVVHNKHPTRSAWHNLRVGPDRPPRPGFPHFHPLQGTRPPPPGETGS